MDLNSRDFAANGGLCPGGQDLGAMHGELKAHLRRESRPVGGNAIGAGPLQLARIDPHILRAQRARTDRRFSQATAETLDGTKLGVLEEFRTLRQRYSPEAGPQRRPAPLIAVAIGIASVRLFGEYVSRTPRVFRDRGGRGKLEHRVASRPHQAAVGPGRHEHQRSRKLPDGMFEVLSACPASGLDGIENQDIDIVTHRLAPVPVWGRIEGDFCASLFRALRGMKGRIRQKVPWRSRASPLEIETRLSTSLPVTLSAREALVMIMFSPPRATIITE